MHWRPDHAGPVPAEVIAQRWHAHASSPLELRQVGKAAQGGIISLEMLQLNCADVHG